MKNGTIKDKQYIQRLLQKYKERLGIEDFLVDLAVTQRKHIISNKQNEAAIKDDPNCGAVMWGDWLSKEFDVVVDEGSLNNDLEDTICHELLHILFWGLTDLADHLVFLTGVPDEKKAELSNELIKREHDIINRVIKFMKCK